MFKYLKMPALLAAAFILAILGAACSGAAPSGPSPSALNSPAAATGRTLIPENALPLSAVIAAPGSVQELVNRYDALVVGAISEISGPQQEFGYGKTAEDYQFLLDQGHPLPSMSMTYYHIRLEEVLLDDGNVRNHPKLRLSHEHSALRPQVGERFLFALIRNPDGESYGVSADWCLLHLDGGLIRNFDGAAPGYAGVTDEATLKAAIQTAVPRRVHLPLSRWPARIRVDENAPAETQAAPGGPAPGSGGPAGNANN